MPSVSWLLCLLQVVAFVSLFSISSAGATIEPIASHNSDFPYDVCGAVCARAREWCTESERFWWCPTNWPAKSSARANNTFTVPVSGDWPRFSPKVFAPGAKNCSCTGAVGTGSIVSTRSDAHLRCVVGMHAHSHAYDTVVTTVMRLVSHSLQIRFQFLPVTHLSGTILWWPGMLAALNQFYQWISGGFRSWSRGLSYTEYGLMFYGPSVGGGGLLSGWLLSIVMLAVGIIRTSDSTNENDWLFAWLAMIFGGLIGGLIVTVLSTGWWSFSFLLYGAICSAPYVITIGAVWYGLVVATAWMRWALFGFEHRVLNGSLVVTAPVPVESRPNRWSQFKSVAVNAYRSFFWIKTVPTIIISDFAEFLIISDFVLVTVACMEAAFFETMRGCGTSPVTAEGWLSGSVSAMRIAELFVKII